MFRIMQLRRVIQMYLIKCKLIGTVASSKQGEMIRLTMQLW